MITHIYSYFIPEHRAHSESVDLPGTKIPLTGKAFEFLKEQYAKAATECTIPIVFVSDPESQVNEVRSTLLAFAAKPSLSTTQPLAERLWSASDARSGPGLLFILVAHQKGETVVLISRYSADTGFTADATKHGLTVSLIERIFLKSIHSYKAAFFRGRSLKSDFWKGTAADRQNRTAQELSDYWIRDFLQCAFEITPARGSSNLGYALKQALKSADTIEAMEEIISAITLARNLDGKNVSPRDFCETYGLSQTTTALVLRSPEVKNTANMQLRFSSPEFHKAVPFRAISLDNGAIISGPTETFSKIWTVTNSSDGSLKYSTVGRKKNERIKARAQ